MKRLIIPAVALAVITIAATAYVRTHAHASVIPNASGHLVYATSDGLAASGYDVVAYFDDQAVEGSAEHTSEYQGATYQFTTAENKAKFDADPEHFVPQYGGYCAWGVAAKNDLFPADPTLFEIVNDKLYLNFNQDVQQKWQADIPGFIDSADELWPGLVRDRNAT